MSTHVGTYDIGERIGGGGMAEVFRARAIGEAGFARPVAIKRVLPHLSENEQFAEMFVNEARLAAMLTHPNIVSVINFARDENGCSTCGCANGPSVTVPSEPGRPPAW